MFIRASLGLSKNEVVGQRRDKNRYTWDLTFTISQIFAYGAMLTDEI